MNLTLGHEPAHGEREEGKEEREQERRGQSSRAGRCRTADDVHVLAYSVGHGKHTGNRVGHINDFRKG